MANKKEKDIEVLKGFLKAYGFLEGNFKISKGLISGKIKIEVAEESKQYIENLNTMITASTNTAFATTHSFPSNKGKNYSFEYDPSVVNKIQEQGNKEKISNCIKAEREKELKTTNKDTNNNYTSTDTYTRAPKNLNNNRDNIYTRVLPEKLNNTSPYSRMPNPKEGQYAKPTGEYRNMAEVVEQLKKKEEEQHKTNPQTNYQNMGGQYSRNIYNKIPRTSNTVYGPLKPKPVDQNTDRDNKNNKPPH